MDTDQAKIVRRRLKEEKLDAEHVLVTLVQALTRRHVDCQFEMRGKPMKTRGGRPRVNSLVAAQDALHEFSLRNAADDPQTAKLQNMLLMLLTDCQFAAENAAGLGGDDDEPKMRLVRD